MVSQPLKSLAAGFTALGLAATGPLTGNAIAEDSRPITRVAATSDMAVLGSAVEYGRADQNNVAVLMYYGSGNAPTPQQVGDALVDRIEQAASRAKFHADVRYFTIYAPQHEGVVVDYLMGGVSIEGVDARKALQRPSREKPVVMADQVIQKRIDVNRTLDVAQVQPISSLE